MMMNRNYQKFLKGQIWYVERGVASIGYGSPSDDKTTRPFLIVSNDDGNATSDVLLMVPITSQPKAKMAVNVEFYIPERGRKTILCSQVTPVHNSKLLNYFGSISTAVMREVDRAVSVALDIHSGKTTLRDIETLIDELYNKHVQELEREKCSVSIDQVIEGIKNKLSTLSYDSIPTPPADPEPEPEPELDQEDEIKPQAKKSANLKKKERKIESGSTGQRTQGSSYWNDERMLEFLIDCESDNTMEATMEKWGIGKKSTAYTYRYSFRNKLGLKGSDSAKNKSTEAAPKDSQVGEVEETAVSANPSNPYDINFEIEGV